MRNFYLIILLAELLVTLTGNSQEYQDWKFMHPTPQPNLLRRIDMIDANTWFAAGANGTLMRTTNAGTNWYFHHFAGKIGSSLDVGQNYNLWFFNSTTGIVAGDKGYIGRTTNAGVTFDSVGIGLIPTNQRCQGIWFYDNNTGFIASGSGGGFGANIVKTTNGGLNWSSVYTSSNYSVTSLWGTDFQTVYAIETNGATLKTTNGGASWTESAVLMGQFMYDVTFLNSNTGFTCGGGGNIYRTTNAGVSWDSVGSGQSNWGLFQVKIISASEIYAVGDPQFLYKSTDGGLSWQALPITVTGPAITYIWYSIDKIGSTLVMTGDYGIAAKSTDGGNTWTSNSILHSTALMFEIQTVPNTSKVWAVGRPFASTTKQVFYSSNSGNNWVTYDLGITGDFFSISMINQNTGYISGQNSKVLKTTNGGVSWVIKTNPSMTNYSFYTIEFLNENTGFTFVNLSTVPGGNVFKTTDGGDNWTQYSTGGTSENIYSADMVDINTGYCSYNPSNRPVYKTTNGGVNWIPLTTGLTGSIRDVEAVNADIVYAGQTSGTSRLAKTTNGGLNWTLITLPAAVDVSCIDFKDANTGYVCGNLTTAICRTTDGGNSWSFQNAHTITLGKVHVSTSDTVYAVGGNTAILRANGSSLTGNINFSGNIIPKVYSLSQNYPNPFNPSTKIQFTLPEASNVSLKVYNVTGELVSVLINGLDMNAGTVTADFNGSELPSGVYFYSLYSDNVLIGTRKMVLIK